MLRRALTIGSAALLGLVTPLPCDASVRFVRGDVSEDGAIDISDPVSLLMYLFLPGFPTPSCLDAGDFDDDGVLAINDAIALLGHLFVPGSPPPAPPFPGCGFDPTPETLSCLATGCPGVGSEWTTAPPLPLAKGAHAMESVGGLIYVIGGGDDWSGNGVTNAVRIFDPASGVWTDGAPVPDSSTWGAATAVVDGKIHLIGGWPGGATLHRRYDPVTDTWLSLAPSPQSYQWGHAAVSIGDQIHVVGGHPSGLQHRVYDAASDTWSTAASAPAISQRTRAEEISGKIYLVGAGNNQLQVYDPALDAWTLGPDVPVQANVPATVVVGGELWVIGGSTFDPNAGGNLANLQAFDPVAGVWSEGPPMPTCRSWTRAELVDGIVHVIGGLDLVNQAVDAHETLDPVAVGMTP